MRSIILHVDMNSYFASVEQQANPFLRGKPVGVCATLSPYGCIVASSCEAKAKGIKTGCRVRDALFLDPNVVLVGYDSNKYRTTTSRIFAILQEYSHRIEAYSIDEAFLDLTGYVATFEDAAAIGRTIQARIRDEVGAWLGCSVGIAPTRWLAKFTSDTIEKGSVRILRREELPAYYDQHKLTDAWGINYRMERRLQRLGLFTLNEVRTADLGRLTHALGRYGYLLWADLNGVPTDGVHEGRLPKSIGHSHVLMSSKERNLGRRVLMKLCEKTGRRLREKRLQAWGMSVWWSFLDEGSFHESWRLPRPAFDTADIFRPAAKLFADTAQGREVLSIAVTTFDLCPRVHQLSFFDDPVAHDAVVLAADAVNDRWGEYVVFRGSMWGTDRHAPDRVGFRKTVSLAPPS